MFILNKGLKNSKSFYDRPAQFTLSNEKKAVSFQSIKNDETELKRPETLKFSQSFYEIPPQNGSTRENESVSFQLIKESQSKVMKRPDSLKLTKSLSRSSLISPAIISPLSFRNKDSPLSSSNRSISVSVNSLGTGRFSRPMSVIDSVNLVRSPAYSMGRAVRKFYDEHGPTSYQASPASYYTERLQTRSPVCVIGRDLRPLNKPDRMGPASYEAGPGSYSPELHPSPKHQTIPSFSIGRAKRFDSNKTS